MAIRDRIRELRRVPASSLRPHPKNWRTHPPAQRDALRGLLAQIGYADALLARPLPDGSLELIDGHLRAEITPDMEVPVLVVDLDDHEAATLLALHDPLAGLAEADWDVLASLQEDMRTEEAALEELMGRLAVQPGPLPRDEPEAGLPREVSIPETFQVVIECRDDAQQKEVYQRMTAEGYKCRLLNL